MTHLSDIRMSRPDYAQRGTAAVHPDKYHPRCGEEHSHKPTKALIGIGLLIVLSFVLYELNGKAHGQTVIVPDGIEYSLKSSAR